MRFGTIAVLMLWGWAVMCPSACAVVFPKPDENQRRAYYYDAATGKPTSVRPSENASAVVWISHNPDGEFTDGWDVVHVEANRTLLHADPSSVYYAAGYAEGVETQHRIWQSFTNYYPFNGWRSNLTGNARFLEIQQKAYRWIDFQWDWVNRTSLAEVHRTDSGQGVTNYMYWREVQNMVQQVQGMIDGYHSLVGGPAHPEYLNRTHLLLLNMYYERSEIVDAVYCWNPHLVADPDEESPCFMPTDDNATRSTERRSRFRQGRLDTERHHTHCSSLIKVTADDLFFGHDTWTTFNTMLRQYKTYAFDRTVAFSGYPGILQSADDWYMMGNGLVSQETTIGFSNPQLTVNVSNQSVPEFVRVMVANRLAVDAQDWTELFCISNSGTLNNQYMIVDMRLFQPNGTTAETRLPDNTMWIVEQLPGYCFSKDVTATLRETSYWASYNLPALPETNALSGNADKEAEFGQFFSETRTNRAQIFRRNQSMVTDMDSMMALMRYNDFRHDNLSLIPNVSTCPNGVCDPPYSPCLAISSRCDLAPKNLTAANGGPLYQYFGNYYFGATDAKVVSWRSMMLSDAAHPVAASLISGPTVQPEYGIPPFSWAAYPSARHEGMPETFDFPVVTTANLVGRIPRSATPTSSSWTVTVGVVTAVCIVLLALIVIIVVCRKRRTVKLPASAPGKPTADTMLLPKAEV